MTDRPAPRVPRANPAPRRALPRVTPLGVGGTVPAGPAQPAAAEPEPEATGRDLLIPNGAGAAGAGAASRRKGRGSATVPTLAELMPPTRPAGHGKGSHAKAAPKDGAKDKHHVEPKDKHHVEPKDKHDGKAKEVDLQVTLSKGLRKRLKAKAAELGLAPEDAVAQLIEVWVDG